MGVEKMAWDLPRAAWEQDRSMAQGALNIAPKRMLRLLPVYAQIYIARAVTICRRCT